MPDTTELDDTRTVVDDHYDAVDNLLRRFRISHPEPTVLIAEARANGVEPFRARARAAEAATRHNRARASLAEALFNLDQARDALNALNRLTTDATHR